MSDHVNALQVENENLKKQIENNGRGVEGLLAQLDAHKGMLNEYIASSLELRANIRLFQKQQQKFEEHIKGLNKQIESLNQQLTDATAKIAELEKPAAA